MYFADYTTSKKSSECLDTKPLSATWYWHNPNSVEKRLTAQKCELCGTTTVQTYEIHHVNKVKNLKGKEHWERIMIAKRRKTMVVCYECHHNIIHGKTSPKDEKH